MCSATWISGKELATIWMSRIAMNMPRHMARKPSQVHALAVALSPVLLPAADKAAADLFCRGLGLAGNGRRDVVDHGALLALARAIDRLFELGKRAEPKCHGMARLAVGRVPMRAVAHGGYGGLGGADQLRDLPVAELRMVLQEPGDRIGLVLPLGDRRVAGALVLHQRNRLRLLAELQACRRVGLAAPDFLGGELAVGDRIEPLHLRRDLAVGDRLYFERMQPAELGDLVEGKARVLDQPDGRRLRH